MENKEYDKSMTFKISEKDKEMLEKLGKENRLKTSQLVRLLLDLALNQIGDGDLVVVNGKIAVK